MPTVPASIRSARALARCGSADHGNLPLALVSLELVRQTGRAAQSADRSAALRISLVVGDPGDIAADAHHDVVPCRLVSVTRARCDERIQRPLGPRADLIPAMADSEPAMPPIAPEPRIRCMQVAPRIALMGSRPEGLMLGFHHRHSGVRFARRRGHHDLRLPLLVPRPLPYGSASGASRPVMRPGTRDRYRGAANMMGRGAWRSWRRRIVSGPPRPRHPLSIQECPMKYAHLGRSGLSVSRICLGTM